MAGSRLGYVWVWWMHTTCSASLLPFSYLSNFFLRRVRPILFHLKSPKSTSTEKKSNTLSAQNWPLQQYWYWFHVFYKTISPFGQKIGPIWLMMALIYHRCHQTENVLDTRCADREHFCIFCVYERCAYSMVSLSLAFSSSHILRRLHRRQQSHTMHIAWRR